MDEITIDSRRSYAIILLVFVTWVSGNSADRRDRCPLTCHCASVRHQVRVSCEDHRPYWKKIPPLPKNTTYFSIRNKNFKVLRTGSFSKAVGKSLQTLRLKGNNISKIEHGAFRNLLQLENLLLTENKIKFLPHGIFSSGFRLVQLGLRDNGFELIPADALCALKRLAILSMSSNKLKTAKFDACFQNLTKLAEIDISNNPIANITPSDFYPFRNTRISTLKLSQLRLSKLDQDMFLHFRFLKILELDKNRLTHLDQAVFQYLKRLTKLSLRGNELMNLPNQILSTFSRLSELHIGENQISNITIGLVFQNLTLLTSLFLSYNPLVTLSNTSFLHLNNCHHLTEVHLSYCKLKYVEPDTFSPMRNLQRLNLNNNPLTSPVLERAFYGLRFASNLSYLNLDCTNLLHLSNTTFQHLKLVPIITLSMVNSNIKVIHAGAFQCFSLLKNLHLQQNAIYLDVDDTNVRGDCGGGRKENGTDLFAVSNRLDNLDLSKNKLFTMPQYSYFRPRVLRVLRMTFCSLGGAICTDLLKGYVELRRLDLSDNEITKISSKAFAHNPNLESLHLKRNKITTLHRDAFDGVNNLKYLVLTENKITSFDKCVFEKVPNLQTLVLSSNQHLSAELKDGIATLFSPLKNISKLELTNTGLQSLPAEIFENLTELSLVALSSNGLTNWDTSLFKHQKKLRKLYLANNKLSIIHKDVIDNLPDLEELNVAENTFICNCDQTWFMNWIRSGSFVYMDNLDSVTCQYPDYRRGMKLVDLYLDEECMSLIFYNVYWLTLFVHMFIVTFATVVYRLRWYIKYWVHLVRARKAMEREMGEERYVFDAFVSYTHQDQKWVVHELLPKMEYEAKIRLCLHQRYKELDEEKHFNGFNSLVTATDFPYRNWLAGRTIARNIIDSIEKSRKTVLVLSNSFARSHWCELELSMAQHKLLTSHRDVVVPILLEPIRQRYVTEQMVCLFATQTYIKWPQRNERKQRRFWKRLIKTLRPSTAEPQYDEDNPNFLTTQVNAIRLQRTELQN